MEKIECADLQNVVELPCKNKLLYEPTIKQILLEDGFNIINASFGDFYISKNYPRYPMPHVYFKRNINYRGLCQTNSPLKCSLEITDRCNLKCKQCYYPDMTGYKRDVPLEDIKKIVDNLKSGSIVNIQLLGGEPSMHPELVEIVKYIKSQGIRVEIVSNGQFLDKEKISKLDGIVDFISISIDGTKDIHDQIRGGGSFLKAKEAFDNIQNTQILNKVLMTITSINKNDIKNVLEEVCYGNPRKLSVKKMLPTDTMRKENKELLLSVDDEVELAIELKKLGISSTLLKPNLKKEGTGNMFGCMGGILSCAIDTQGNIFRCLYQRSSEEVIGNIYQNNIIDLREKHNQKKSKMPLPKQECKECSSKSVCGGICDVNK